MIDTRTLEAFAASARSQLMAEVEARLTAVLSPASTAREEFPSAIKELEKRTGIDFFCNLPDEIEKNVESNVERARWN